MDEEGQSGSELSDTGMGPRKASVDSGYPQLVYTAVSNMALRRGRARSKGLSALHAIQPFILGPFCSSDLTPCVSF